MIRLKNEGDRARIRGATPEITAAMFIFDGIYTQETGLPDTVITSIGEIGDFREKGSKHLTGNAFDVRTRDLGDYEIDNIATKARDHLGPDFDVVVESNHIHVEFDPEP